MKRAVRRRGRGEAETELLRGRSRPIGCADKTREVEVKEEERKR